MTIYEKTKSEKIQYDLDIDAPKFLLYLLVK